MPIFRANARADSFSRHELSWYGMSYQMISFADDIVIAPSIDSFSNKLKKVYLSFAIIGDS